jgi:hypothetical protein
LEFFISADLGAAREFKFLPGQLPNFVFNFLFGFIEDLVVGISGIGYEVWGLRWVGWVVGGGKAGLDFRLGKGESGWGWGVLWLRGA